VAAAAGKTGQALCIENMNSEVNGDKVFQVQIENRPLSSRGQSFTVRFGFFHG